MKTQWKVAGGIVASLALGSWWIATANLSPDALGRRFATALQEYEDGPLYETLLEKGLDPNYRYDPEAEESLREKWTALVAGSQEIPHQTYPLIYMASQHGNKDAIRALIKHKVNVNVDINGSTPLTTAIDCKNADAVDMLIKSGVDINYHYGNDTPMKHAIFSQNQKIITLLKRAGAIE